MNNGHAPPYQYPPPPRPPPGPAAGSASPPQRRPEVPSISTALSPAQRFGPHLQPGTPASPHLGSTPASPRAGYSPFTAQTSSPMATTRVPANISTTYNPSEWRRGGPVSGAYMPHASRSGPQRATSTRDATGMEATSMLPSPPPPYSPSPQSAQHSSRSMFASPNLSTFTSSPTNYNSEHATPISAATSISSGGFPSFQRTTSSEHVPSNLSQPSPTPFPPPPPGARDRSGSRPRFNLSTLTSRHRTSPSSSNNNAMEHLQQQTIYALSQHAAPQPQYGPIPVVPPAARRAASTGAIQNTPAPLGREHPEIGTTASPEQIQHGFPLPPPPPGPPPGGRSQSLNRMPDYSLHANNDGQTANIHSASRMAAMRSSQLGPIPPTPAGWTEENSRQQTRSTTPSQRAPSQQRHATRPSEDLVDVSAENGQTEQRPHVPAAVPRDASVVRGIRERRSESRASREPSSTRESQAQRVEQREARVPDAKPVDLVLQPAATGALGRRRHVSKAKISPLLDGRTSPAIQRRRQNSEAGSASQPGSSSLPLSGGQGSMPSTPFPTSQSHSDLYDSPAPRSQTPRDQPLSGKDAAWEGASRSDTGSANKQRPISHILHTPINEQPAIQPLVPSRPSSSKGLPSSHDDVDLPPFAREAIARHAKFVEAEAKAGSDEERLQLFADFLVHESRVRRDRYAQAFDTLGSDVLDLTRDMWRSYNNEKRHKKALSSIDTVMKGQAQPPPPSSGSDNMAEGLSATSRSVQSDAVTPISMPSSPTSLSSKQGARATSKNAFQPMLSPIQSMAMSTIIDDSESSRGRSASRWWETSTDANSIGGARRVERSLRETKYMGLPREARENLQWDSIPEDPGPGPSHHSYYYGPDEYPPEKTGWHHDSAASAGHARHFTPEPQGVDMSRLVTLPPSYPRHHPAVNNKHPDLAPLRGVLRTLNAREEVERVREEYEAGSGGELMQLERPEETVDRRKMFRRSIQDSVNLGEMSYAEAAKAEEDFDATEAKRGRDQAQKALDHFTNNVVKPLDKMFKDGINKASVSIEQLSDSLSYEAQSHNPNQTQEEGDEQPELLEKLTLIKWFHEAREQLHKEMFNLEADSDERFKTLVLLPYRQAGNTDKVHEVESFFDRDSQERRVRFEKEALRRFEELLRTTEKHVSRGAEVQLSAFWDIAPELLAVIQKVPNDLSGFDLMVPPHEVEENPNYHDHPMQYLYTILTHSEKSAYQFIEAQTNLLCLLHEVKSAVMNASCRLMETERVMEGEEAAEVEREMKDIRKGEDASLTGDLKERVNLVEEQWRQALGKGLEECKQRIKVFLFERGGWDDCLEE